MYVSKYFYFTHQDLGTSTIWNSVFGRPMLVPNEFVEFLTHRKAVGLEVAPSDFDEETYDTLVEAHILVSSHEQEEKDIEALFTEHNKLNTSKVKSLSLIMSEECPFRCTYCIHFANSKHYYNPEKMMTEEVAKKSIDEYFVSITENNQPSGYINFGGGEPLLNYPTIAKLLPYIDNYRKKLDIPIRISINTNLSLLTREMAENFIKYDVEIAASLDGTKDGNDKVRLTKDLKGTYDRIINGFNILEELGRPFKSFAMTVTEANFSDVDTKIIDWAASKGMEEVRIDIDIVGMVNVPVKTIVEKLMAVRKYAKTKNISVIGFWSRPAENMGLTPEIEDIGFCGGERGNSVCVAPSGQVFPCGYSNYQIGVFDSISKIQTTPEYQSLLQRRNLLKLDGCKNCPILGFCRGGCLITREANETDEKQKTMCEFYVAMTKEIIRESAEA